MRRALRLAALVALLLAGATVALGVVAARREATMVGDVIARDAHAPFAVVHGIVGHAAALSACVVAAMTFLLGLHGLLEADGRRLRAALLFVLSPALMGIALWADLTGLRGREQVGATLAADEVERFLASHAPSGWAFVATGFLAVVVAWTLVRPDKRRGSGDPEDDELQP